MTKQVRMHLNVEERTDFIMIKNSNLKFYPHPELDDVYVATDGTVAKMWYTFNEIRIMKPTISKDGYKRVVLTIKDPITGELTKNINKLCHRLVAETFIPVPEGLKDIVVDHNDNNRSNCSLYNLRWMTRNDNLKKRDDDGSLLKTTFVFDRTTDINTQYASRQIAAKAINMQTSNLTNAIKHEQIIRGRYYVSDIELTSDDLYFIFKEYDLHQQQKNTKKVGK